MKWISVKDKLPEYKKGNFLAYWENENLMLVCFIDMRSDYIVVGSSIAEKTTCGHGQYPKFSHWMPLPKPPKKTRK